MSALPHILATSLASSMGHQEPTSVERFDAQPWSETDITYVEARREETVVRSRPWVPAQRIATINAGTRLKTRAQVPSRDEKGCRGKPWLAVYPYGFVCSTDVRTTQSAPELEVGLPLPVDSQLPYRYARVHVDETSVYRSTEQIRSFLPEKKFFKGMNLAVARNRTVDEIRYVETIYGDLVSRDDVHWMGSGSDWRGVILEGSHVGPSFAWTKKKKNRVFESPDPAAKVVATLPKRQRVPLFEHAGSPKQDEGFRKVGENRWIQGADLNEVILLETPDDIETYGPDVQWIDVDTGEQVIVAYHGSRPQFATLISSGRAHPTPLGTYPIWAKVAATTMGNQAYEDSAYRVEGVPWVLLFQGHNALHAAYWHNSFGIRKSHGCVNLSPQDARWFFDWAMPSFHSGWTGYLPNDLRQSAVVRVRNSHATKQKEFSQERPVGPPDREAEKLKLEEAETRRAELAALEDSTDTSADADEPSRPQPVSPNFMDRAPKTQPRETN